MSDRLGRRPFLMCALIFLGTLPLKSGHCFLSLLFQWLTMCYSPLHIGDHGCGAWLLLRLPAVLAWLIFPFVLPVSWINAASLASLDFANIWLICLSPLSAHVHLVTVRPVLPFTNRWTGFVSASFGVGLAIGPSTIGYFGAGNFYIGLGIGLGVAVAAFLVFCVFLTESLYILRPYDHIPPVHPPAARLCNPFR